MQNNLFLRNVVKGDLSIFFAHQLDPEANYMAAFTAKDPTSRKDFTFRWNRILGSPNVIIKTIVYDDQVAGHVLSYEQEGKTEVSYWIDKALWGLGIATRALSIFLTEVNKTRPIFARVAKDNLASLRVLEKCGFRVNGAGRGFANARGAEIEELILELPT